MRMSLTYNVIDIITSLTFQICKMGLATFLSQLVSFLRRTLYKAVTLHKKKNFRLTKICEKDNKGDFFISFCMCPFRRNIKFSELSFR